MAFPPCFNHHTTVFRSHFFKMSTIFAKSSFASLKIGRHTVAMHHLRAGGTPYRGTFARLQLPQSPAKHRRAPRRQNRRSGYRYAGKISSGAGEHIVRHILAAVPHDFFHCNHKGIVDGDVPFIERLHPRLFRIVPRHFTGGYSDDVSRLRQRLGLRVVVRRDPQSQRTAGGNSRKY